MLSILPVGFEPVTRGYGVEISLDYTQTKKMLKHLPLHLLLLPSRYGYAITFFTVYLQVQKTRGA